MKNMKNMKNIFTSIKDLFKKDYEKIIEELKDEHKYLLILYHEIIHICTVEKDIERLNNMIDNFLNILKEHLEKENKEIYEFFDNTITDELIKEHIEKIRKDIKIIDKKLKIILKKHRKIKEETLDSFLRDFSYLIQMIIKRVELEENIIYSYFLRKKSSKAI